MDTHTTQSHLEQTMPAPPTSASESEVSATMKTEEKPRAKVRCFVCHKNVGLMGFDCRCGHVFCGTHKYSDRHNCTFDYKADASEKLRKENPVVIGEKIQKI